MVEDVMVEVVGRDGDVRWRAYIRLMLAGVATREAARFMQRGGARDKGHGAPMKRPAGWLQRLRPFGIGARWSGRPLARPDFGCGCSSGVEHDLAKVGVEGSNPFARSKDLKGLRPDSFVQLHATSTHRVIGNDRPGCNPADLVYDIIDRPACHAQIVRRI